MQLWQLDILFGPRLVDTATGEVREARIVTGVDDHSRYCVLARVVERATGRAVCLAFTEALQRYGAPEEVLTDNGKQFTDRFGRGGEVLFDKICRRNGITHRLTQPRSPTTTGKVERFHQTLRRELLDDARPFVSVLEAQATLDERVREYSADRPHQSLELREPVTPAERFEPAPDQERELLPLWLPGSLASVPAPASTPTAERAIDAGAAPEALDGGPVEFERVIPPSGNLWAMGRQFWLGPARGSDRSLLGQRRRHPPHDQRRARQEPALAPFHRRLTQPAVIGGRMRHTSRGRAARRGAASARTVRAAGLAGRSVVPRWRPVCRRRRRTRCGIRFARCCCTRAGR
jgi:hypothetical protein